MSSQEGTAVLSLIKKVFPFLDWLSNYKTEDLPGDLIAGTVVAIMLVPQSMAYAMLAGLPPETGLYASIVPVLVYAVFGSSKVLAVGPVAMVSLLTAAGLSQIAEGDVSQFVALALLLALLSGVIQLAMGLLRLGSIVNYLSHPVLIGFTSAAALVIGASQLKHILGIEVARTEYPFQLIPLIFSNLRDTNPETLAIGTVAIIVLSLFGFGFKKLSEVLKLESGVVKNLAKAGSLVVVCLSVVVVASLGLDKSAGVAVVGTIPQGLSGLTMPTLEASAIGSLLPTAFIISLVGFTESFSIGTALASKRRQRIDANKELIALGSANIAASFSGGYPVTGGLSRSAVNYNAGANTGLASIVTALLIVITVLFLTPLFYYLPKAALAAIVIVAVAGLFDVSSFFSVWKYNKADAVAMITTFVGVIAINIETGIAIGIASALFLHLRRTSKPHMAVVGRVGNSEHFRNVERHMVTTCPGTHAIRIDESLYFANARELEAILLRAAAKDKSIENILLICSAVNVIDSSALETLRRIIDELDYAGVKLYFAEIKGPVMDRLVKVGFFDGVGHERVFLSTHEAFESFGCRSTPKA